MKTELAFVRTDRSTGSWGGFATGFLESVLLRSHLCVSSLKFCFEIKIRVDV